MLPIPIAVTLRVTSLLERLGVPYFLGGSLASTLFGAPRTTLDSDIVADLKPGQVALLVRDTEADFYVDEQMIRDAIDHQAAFNLIHLETAFKVDVFVRSQRPFDRAQFARRQKRSLADQPESQAFVASLEDTILAKLEWYRLGGEVSERQWRDVVGVWRACSAQLDYAYLQKWAAQLGIVDLLQPARDEAT